MVDVRRVTLPGVGVLHSLTTADGAEVAVVAHRTGRSDLVLLQAEVDPGEARFLYSAPGEFGSLAMSPNGNWLLVGWVNADQWLFLRLTAAKVQAVSNISQQFGVETAGKPLRNIFPETVSWCCPASP